jgi:hypothetical protein
VIFSKITRLTWEFTARQIFSYQNYCNCLINTKNKVKESGNLDSSIGRAVGRQSKGIIIQFGGSFTSNANKCNDFLPHSIIVVEGIQLNRNILGYFLDIYFYLIKVHTIYIKACARSERAKASPASIGCPHLGVIFISPHLGV